MIENLIGTLAVIGLGSCVLLALRSIGTANREDQMDPQVVLRHCRQEMQLVRLELESYPASKEMYEIFAAIGEAEHTIDSVAARLSKAGRG